MKKRFVETVSNAGRSSNNRTAPTSYVILRNEHAAITIDLQRFLRAQNRYRYKWQVVLIKDAGGHADGLEN